MINRRISELRAVMKDAKIDAYIIPSEDFHQSEYVGEYFKARAFISGFTDSARLVIVTATEASLWTDGRYFIQAENQLKGSEVILQRMGEPGVPTPEEYLKEKLSKGACIGFDGRVVSLADGKSYQELAQSINGSLVCDVDLIDRIWKDRPPISEEPAFYLDEKYSGESSVQKVERVRQEMKGKDADIHVLSALDDICWLLNIRGNDVKYSPLVLCYAVITSDRVHIFIDEKKITEEISNSFTRLNARIHPYNDIYEFVKTFEANKRVWLDPSKLNFALYRNIPSDVILIELANPSIVFKARKNETEIENIKQAHIKDGVAWARFMYWLKHHIGKIEITEISAAEKLESFRKEQEGYLWASFAPISGYRGNGAIVHYEATPETNKRLEAESLYLSDTGGNYMQGSTDITRTLALGELTAQEKLHFTTVLKCHIGLASANFLEGAAGYALDILARKPLWDMNLDYKHGTGHGIGYLLNIHEGPVGIRYKILPNRSEHHPFEPNMVITNEPGIYIQDQYGIRLENEMIVTKGVENEFGQFLHFEPCTYVPFDLDAVDASLLTEPEKQYLNQYHQMVYATVSPYLPEEEREWLKKYTKTIV